MSPALNPNSAWPSALLTLTSIVLVAALAWLAASLTWLILEPESALPPIAATALPEIQTEQRDTPREAEPTESGFARAAQVALFGNSEERDEIPTAAPETRLSLKLLGVSATPGAGGTAIIRANSGQAQLYRPDDEIGDGLAILRRVEPHQVILERDGRFEALRLPRGDELRIGGDSAPQPLQRSEAEPEPSRAAGTAQPRIDRDRWMGDPEQVMDAIRTEPVMRGGSLHGIRVEPRRNQREFEQAGLQPGDVLTTVNGQAISSIADPEALLGELRGSSHVEVVVERDGQAIPLSIELAN
ncbi:MAG: type II secretion system protein N [Pseudomonadota bacterium]